MRSSCSRMVYIDVHASTELTQVDADRGMKHADSFYHSWQRWTSSQNKSTGQKMVSVLNGTALLNDHHLR